MEVFYYPFRDECRSGKLKVYTSSEPGSWLRQESSSRSATTETQEVTLNAAPNRGGIHGRPIYFLLKKKMECRKN